MEKYVFCQISCFIPITCFCQKSDFVANTHFLTQIFSQINPILLHLAEASACEKSIPPLRPLRMTSLSLGRDDFNFLSWIVSASSYIVSVTERNSLDSMVLVRVVPHTQHKRYPCDRNFSKEWKNRFLVSCSVNLNRCLPYSLNPPQLPRETLWMGCVRSGIWPTPPTSAHIVTEKDSHWEKTIHMVRRGS